MCARVCQYVPVCASVWQCWEAQICIPNRAHDKGAYLQIFAYAALQPGQKRKKKKKTKKKTMEKFSWAHSHVAAASNVFALLLNPHASQITCGMLTSTTAAAVQCDQ